MLFHPNGHRLRIRLCTLKICSCASFFKSLNRKSLFITFSKVAMWHFYRIQYRKDAQHAYQQRMLEAHAGHGDFPRVRTFRQLDSSTNNVFDDLKEAERWTGIQGKVDMAELTWEQRERILRMLFAKMNRFKEKRRYDIYIFLLCMYAYALWMNGMSKGVFTRSWANFKL